MEFFLEMCIRILLAWANFQKEFLQIFKNNQYLWK